MAKKKETAIATVDENVYCPFIDMGVTVEDILDEGLGGEEISAFDLETITIPGGGAPGKFARTSLENPDGDMVSEIVGVILAMQAGRQMWRQSYDESGGGTDPDCVSFDMDHGVGDPGGDCSTCELNQFGSDGPGKKCKETKNLFILERGKVLPTVLRVSPGSLGAVRQYRLALTGRMMRPDQVETRISLRSATRKNAKMTYWKLHFASNGTLNEGDYQRIFPYKQKFLSSVRTQRALPEGE